MRDSWVACFFYRNKDILVTAWTTPMKPGCHQADSDIKYRQYFELLHHKVVQYKLEREPTYDMDKKGFAIGVTGRSKRIFGKVLYGKKQLRLLLHNNDWEWLIPLATIGADGTVFPPVIFITAASRAVQAS